MRGKATQWGIPTTLTIVYRPSQNKWYALININIPTAESKFGSGSDLEYESIVAFDLGTHKPRPLMRRGSSLPDED